MNDEFGFKIHRSSFKTKEVPMPPRRLAIVGAGIAARDLHLPALRQLRDRYQMVAVIPRTPRPRRLPISPA